ncbi:MAG: MerR family transcriptional regulator [Acidobacteriota bacterium]
MGINIPDKLTFKKREVINLTRLDGKVLDYWEKEFDNLNPVVNKNGDKFYTRIDIDLILRIKELLIEKKSNKEETKKLIYDEFNGIEKVDIQKKKIDKDKLGQLNIVKNGLKDILTILDKDDKK